jgi:hypothetical protein
VHEPEGLAGAHVRLDLPFVYFLGDVIREPEDEQVRGVDSIGNPDRLKTGVDRSVESWTARPLSHEHPATRVAQVLGMRRALGTVTENGDSFVVQVVNGGGRFRNYGD